MTIVVDHEQRRGLILERAFALFAEEGFGGVTYQKIADRCEISRTAIYKYFKNKEEIFMYAIKLATGNLNGMVEKVLARKDWTAEDKIRRVLHITIRMLAENHIFLTVVLDFILTQKEQKFHNGQDVRRRVRRHTFGMKFLIAKLLREATKTGGLCPNCFEIPETSCRVALNREALKGCLQEKQNACGISARSPDIAASHLYGILESFVLNLTVTGILDEKDCIDLVDSYLDSYLKETSPERRVPRN